MSKSTHYRFTITNPRTGNLLADETRDSYKEAHRGVRTHEFIFPGAIVTIYDHNGSIILRAEVS